MEQSAELSHVRSSAGLRTSETGWNTREKLIIPGLSNFTQRTRETAIVTLTIGILAGCASARTWPDGPGQAGIGPSSAPMKPGEAFDLKAACDEVVRAHNRIRVDAKLPALAVSSKLQAAAERHAKDMAARDRMTHKGGDGSAPIERIKATGYTYRRAGENIAAGRFTVERLMIGWMDSPPHKRNILGSFSQIGVACATSESGKRYWCVTFGLPNRR
jgi:uncharacterized protein YkwD